MISAFDLDGTLLRANSSYAFAKYLRRHRQFSFPSIAYVNYYSLQQYLNLLSLEELHLCAFNKLFLGRNSDHITEWGRRFVLEHLDELLYAPALAKLQSAQKAGHLTAILSSSPDFLVTPIAEALGVQRVLATRYGVDKDGNFCEIESIVLGGSKANYLQVLCSEIGYSLQDVTAYSDSHHDIEFLKAAGHPVAVNPNAKLRSYSMDRGWSII